MHRNHWSDSKNNSHHSITDLRAQCRLSLFHFSMMVCIKVDRRHVLLEMVTASIPQELTRIDQLPNLVVFAVAARGCFPPSLLPSHPCNQISNWYSYAYNDGISVDCEQYTKLGV